MRYTEPIEIAGIDCTLQIYNYPSLCPPEIGYKVLYPGGSTTERIGILTEDNGTLRKAAIGEAEARIREEYAEWEQTLS